MRCFIVASFVSLALSSACSTSQPTKTASAPGSSNDAPAPGSPPASTPAPAGGACGGLTGLACEKGLYCSFSPDAMCGAADQTGRCTPVPEVCTHEFAPVCGCNDKTYPNACSAAREGISVGRAGECAPANDTRTDAGSP